MWVGVRKLACALWRGSLLPLDKNLVNTGTDFSVTVH